MTHDELLDRIAQEGLKPDGNVLNTRLILAFRAVVELHRPEAQEHRQYKKCWNCNLLYPCPTIQAIEAELK